jgi:hypothetical protein
MRGALRAAKPVVAGIGHREKRVADGGFYVKYFALQSQPRTISPPNGKMELWRTFGAEGAAGIESVRDPRISSGGTAYPYGYRQSLSEAHVVTGLK